MSDTYEGVIRNYYRDVFCTGSIDVAAVDQYMVANFVVHDLFLQHEGREGYKHFLSLLMASFREIDPLVVHDFLSCNDRIVTRWSCIAKHTSEFMGIPATNRQVKIKGIDIFRLTNGEIADLWQEIDFRAILQQIMAPSPLQQ